MHHYVHKRGKEGWEEMKRYNLSPIKRDLKPDYNLKLKIFLVSEL